MSSSFKDIPVSFVGEDTLASVANKWRAEHAKKFGDHFNVVEFLIHTIIPNRNRPTFIKLFDRETNDDSPAYVSFDPDIINIDQTIWALANNMSGYSQFVIAHEIGHLLFHSSLTKNFSNDPNTQIKYFENEHSAEWQANKFAEHVILPDFVVQKFSSADEITWSTGCWSEIAQSRYTTVNRPKLVEIHENHHGEACAKCGDISFQRRNFILKCNTCKIEKSIFKFIAE